MDFGGDVSGLLVPTGSMKRANELHTERANECLDIDVSEHS